MAIKLNYNMAQEDNKFCAKFSIKIKGRKKWIDCEGYDGAYFDDDPLPTGKYGYYCRHKEFDWGAFESVKKNKGLTVNFWGTIVTDEPIDFGDTDELKITRWTYIN